MTNRILTGLIFTWFLVAQPLDGVTESTPAANWLPESTIATFQLDHPESLLNLVLDPEFIETITALPAYQKIASDPGFKEFQGVIAYLEATLGTEWKAAIRKLIGEGVTFAILPSDSVLLMIDSKDADLLQRLHETILTFAKADATNPEKLGPFECEGAEIWTFGGDEMHAVVDNRFILSNRRETIEAALHRHAEPSGESLSAVPEYVSARKAAGADTTATAFVHLKTLKQHPPFQQALAGTMNPLLALLFAGLTDSIQESNWMAMGLDIEGKSLALRALSDAKAADPSGPAAFAVPAKPEEGPGANITVPRQIAGLSVYRDLYKFYTAKDELFPERTSGLIFFENMMGIFFSGRDLTEEVFAEMQPDVRLVVAEQTYDPSIGDPSVQLPQFAMVFHVRDAEEFGVVFEEAWQKAVGLVNFTRGQQGLPGLIIDRVVHNETKFTVGYFAAPSEKEEQIPIRYNLRPAVARVDEYVILSSTDGLAKDLIDSLKQEETDSTKSPGYHSVAQIDGLQLASILTANKEHLIRQNMLEKGQSREQAEGEINLMTTVLKLLGQARLNLGGTSGQPIATLVLDLNLQ